MQITSPTIRPPKQIIPPPLFYGMGLFTSAAGREVRRDSIRNMLLHQNAHPGTTIVLVGLVPIWPPSIDMGRPSSRYGRSQP
jgi:hypothetical protein